VALAFPCQEGTGGKRLLSINEPDFKQQVHGGIMKKAMVVFITLALVLTFGFLGNTSSFAAEGEKGVPQTKCPVMGSNIDKKVYLDYQGKRIYFCCPECIKTFKEQPDVYIKKMEEQGIILEKSP
jgi:YHS domain-containing protein